jgi:hypothetical protein
MTQNNQNLPGKSGAPIGLPPVICSASDFLDSEGSEIKVGDVLWRHRAFLRVVRPSDGHCMMAEMLDNPLLWPISKGEYARQFMVIIINEQRGDRTWERIKRMPEEDRESMKDDLQFLSQNVEARHGERRQPLGIAYADLLGSLFGPAKTKERRLLAFNVHLN